MELLIEIAKFFILALLIVLISKYVLVGLLRRLAETLSLKPKTVGNISGIATSVPELLTVSFSAYTGLIDASIINILSSNVINFIQYIVSIIMSKNFSKLKNKAIKIDIFLVFFTILIPILMLILNIEVSITIVPIFILLFIMFYVINNNAHKLYLKKEETVIFDEIEEEEKWLKGKKIKTLKYIIFLLITCVLLFIVGNGLSNTLESLCLTFNISQAIIGILLGFITSLPELITFFEAQRHHKEQKDEQAGVVEATNNLLSSNILNLFAIQTIGILIYTFIIK